MVGSGLFDEQPEFADIADNPDLVDEMVAQIPELLTALYLICHAPEEKPALLAAPPLIAARCRTQATAAGEA